MKVLTTRILAVAALAAMAATGWLVLAGAATTKSAILEPDKLIILSTTDVKGKATPCG